MSYDAWGNRRDVATWAVYTTLPTGILLTRGFTGHEHIDLFDLINMDGRVYDPVLGRFLSPDPIIQNPNNLQSLNRYSYCLNNPLSLTDPSGYSWLGDNWKTIVAAVVAIVVTYFTVGAGSSLGYAILAGASGGFAGGFTGALLYGADLGQAFKAGAIGAIIGGISAGLTYGVGSINFDDIVGIMLAHGIVQGGISEMSGGKFVHGFFSGAFTAGFAPGIMQTANTKAGAVVASAIVGGTASAIGGGKFANGAITGAFVMLFNEMMHSKKGDPTYKNQYGKKPITLDQFRAEYNGCTESEIITGEASKFGYTFPNRIDGNGSFVTLDNGREVDMTHFFVVGRRGFLMGIANELTQIGTQSFFYNQDLYSNELGIKFFDNYSKYINQNPTRISEYIYWYLSNPVNINTAHLNYNNVRLNSF